MSNVKTTYLGSAIVPDGYSGGTCKVFLCYDPDSQKTLAVHPGGFFTSSVPPACDYKEAARFVQNHPACDNMNNFAPLVVEIKKKEVKTSKKEKTRVFVCYSDPQHGWIKVPRKLLVELGVADQITTCSYQNGDFVYLEWDCDAVIFFDRLKDQGVTPVIRSKSTDRSSRIRNYDSYRHCIPSQEPGNNDVPEKKEIILLDEIYEGVSPDVYTCACGNDPETGGFHPCLEDGTEVDPDSDCNWKDLYACAKCGQLYKSLV